MGVLDGSLNKSGRAVHVVVFQTNCDVVEVILSRVMVKINTKKITIKHLFSVVYRCILAASLWVR